MSKKDSISGDNSLLFGKIKFDPELISKIKSIKLPSQIDKTDFTSPAMPDLRNLLKKPDLTPQEILTFLKDDSIKQSETATRQFNTTKWLTYLIIGISIISITPTLIELFSPNQNKILSEHILKIEEENRQNSKVISELSIRLLDLQNQVQTLEKQNGEISKKKND